MKELLLQYAKYNIWANKRIIETLIKMEPEQLDMHINSSFPSIRQTVYHSWSAEYVWLQRLQLVEHPIWAEAEYDGDFATACENWLKTATDLLAFIEKQFDDKAFAHVVQYYSRQKQSFKTPVSVILHHTFNHATHHRGQLVTMMRQAGVKKIPGTDIILFSRDKKSK